MEQRDKKLQGVSLAPGTKVGTALYHTHHSAVAPVLGTNSSKAS